MSDKIRPVDLFVEQKYSIFVRDWFQKNHPEHYETIQNNFTTRISSIEVDRFFVRLPLQVLYAFIRYLENIGISMMLYKGHLVELTPQRAKEQTSKKIKNVEMRGVILDKAATALVAMIESNKLSATVSGWEEVSEKSDAVKKLWAKKHLLKHPQMKRPLLDGAKDLPEVRAYVRKRKLREKLLRLMKANDQRVVSFLQENDPGLWIQWDERACKTCGSVKKKWADRVIDNCPEIVEFLGGTPEEF